MANPTTTPETRRWLEPVTSVQRLESGYWHVRFGPQTFVQFSGLTATPDDVFGAEDRLKARYADAATAVVAEEMP